MARRAIGTRADWRLRWPRLALPRFGRHLIGPLLVFASVVASWFAFTNAQGEEGDVRFGLFIGAASIVLMAWSFVLALRPRRLEGLFGGLDRMYRVHRWAGALAVVAMFLHTRAEPEVEGGIRGASRSIANQAEGLAGVGEIMIYILVALSLIRWFPYRLWRWTHKLLGIPFAFACWHFFTAEKPYANTSGWGWWFNGVMLAGLGAFVARVGWRDMVSRGRRYTITDVRRSGSTTELRLAPIGDALPFDAGQFAAVKLQVAGLREPHVFTIASGPAEPELRFFIRDLGDWTAKLQTADLIGARARIEGPYGRFRPLPTDPAAPTIWVAGGVGITPFLSAIASLDDSQVPPTLVYCIARRDDATALADLEAAEAAGRITLHLVVSGESGRLDEDRFRRLVGSDEFAGAHVAVCGPHGLVQLVDRTARSLGARDVEHEDFDIRSGIGPDLSATFEEIVADRPRTKELGRSAPRDLASGDDAGQVERMGRRQRARHTRRGSR